MKELWVEKYRPNTVDGYVFVDDAQRDQVQQWIKDGSIPHLMLSGSAGTGKTTLAKMLINELGTPGSDEQTQKRKHTRARMTYVSSMKSLLPLLKPT